MFLSLIEKTIINKTKSKILKIKIINSREIFNSN